MNTHAEKIQENKSQSVANTNSQRQSSSKSTFQLVDNRPEAIAQRKLQEMANNSQQVKQLKTSQKTAMNANVIQLAGKDADEYKHIAIDKGDIGVHYLIMNLNMYGLRTAESIGIKLSEGSEKLKHHQHVFMWDNTSKGAIGAKVLQDAGKDDRVTIRIRNKGFKQQGGRFSGGNNLKGDNGELGGASSNGAWAVEGDVHRRFIFIEGLDSEGDEGYQDWKEGKGWPPGHEIGAQIRLLRSPIYLNPERKSKFHELQSIAFRDFDSLKRINAFTIAGRYEYEEKMADILEKCEKLMLSANGKMEINQIFNDGKKRLHALSNSVE